MGKIDVNMEFDVEIIDYTSDGRGVCRVNGYPIFVPFSAVGDKLKIIVTKNKKTYFEGITTNIIECSKDRVTPNCKHFGQCGGCDLLHLSYPNQIKFKENTVKKALTKITKNDKIIVNKALQMDNPLYYRNKAIYNFDNIDGKIICGFYKKKSNDVVETIDCNIVHKKIENIRCIIQDFCNKNNYMPKKLAVKYSFDMNEIMVCLVVNEKKFMLSENLISTLSAIIEVKSIIINYADKNTINFGKKSEVIFGNDYIVEKIGNLSFKNYLTSFFQVNPVQTKTLYNKAISLLNLNEKDVLIDLYCGVGTISLMCAKNVKKTIGIEIVDYAIKSAKQNAEDNAILNSDFILSDAQNLLKYIDASDSLKIVVDPPRKGLDKKVIDSITSLNPTCIAYISCDEGTLARDLKIFEELNYFANDITPVDMFCGSFHIETVTLLSKLN